MLEPAPDFAAAFSRLERALLARRLAAIEPALRVEIAALGAVLTAFLFWQMRLRRGAIAFVAASCAPSRATSGGSRRPGSPRSSARSWT